MLNMDLCLYLIKVNLNELVLLDWFVEGVVFRK